MVSKRLTSVISSLIILWFSQTPATAQITTSGPDVGYPLEFSVSGPVSNMPPQAGRGRVREIPEHQPPRRPRPGSVTDPVVQSTTPTATVAQGQGWEGLGVGYTGFGVSAVPPDPNMAVGPNHI